MNRDCKPRLFSYVSKFRIDLPASIPQANYNCTINSEHSPFYTESFKRSSSKTKPKQLEKTEKVKSRFTLLLQSSRCQFKETFTLCS